MFERFAIHFGEICNSLELIIFQESFSIPSTRPTLPKGLSLRVQGLNFTVQFLSHTCTLKLTPEFSPFLQGPEFSFPVLFGFFFKRLFSFVVSTLKNNQGCHCSSEFALWNLLFSLEYLPRSSAMFSRDFWRGINSRVISLLNSRSQTLPSSIWSLGAQSVGL